MELVEKILWQGAPLAYIVRAELAPDKTTFLTPDDFKQQVGLIVYPAGKEVPRHVHLSLERKLVGTSEVVIVKKGLCELDIYSNEKELVATRRLRIGDIAIMPDGGHGFRMLEDTILLEIKQGPYAEVDEKKRF